MGIGAGILLLALGAVLSWAVEVDLPYVDDDALGAILLALGITVLVASAVVDAARSRGTEDPAAGLVLLLVGAVLVWGLDVDVPHVHDAALGGILMLGGAVVVGATVYMNQQRTRTRRVVEHRY